MSARSPQVYGCMVHITIDPDVSRYVKSNSMITSGKLALHSVAQNSEQYDSSSMRHILAILWPLFTYYYT